MSQTTTPTADDDSTETQADVFEQLDEGDKVTWDGKKQPLTVTAGYQDTDDDHAPPVFVEGPQGGEKMLTQNKHNPDRISADSFSLSSNGSWISGLEIVAKAS